VAELDFNDDQEMAKNPLNYALTLNCYKRFLNARFNIKAFLQEHASHVFLDDSDLVSLPVLRDMVKKYQANVQFIDWRIEKESWQYITRAMLPEWGRSDSLEFDDTKTIYYDKDWQCWICKPFYYWREIDFKAYWALQEALKKRLKKQQD
jgi:hypothetical protein